MAQFCPMGTGRKLFTFHKTAGLKFFHGRQKRKSSSRIQGSEDSHSLSSSQASETHEEENCEKLDYVMKWNASVIKGLQKSASLESISNSSVSRSSNRSADSILHSNSSGSRTSLDSLSKSDENLANWKGRKVYNSVRKTHSMENLKHCGQKQGLTKPELDSLLSGISCGKSSRVRVKLLWNFEPMSDRELRVYKGEIVQVLYKEKEWLYAVKSDGKQGYIPYNHCTLVRKSDINHELQCNGVISNRKKELVDHTRSNGGLFTLLRSCSAESVMDKYSQEKPPDESLNENFERELLIPKRVKAQRFIPTQTVYTSACNSRSSSDTRRSSLQNSRKFPRERSRKSSEDNRKDQQFCKMKCDIVRVLYDYRALDENDLSVKRDELLQVLNKEDQDWWWVRKDNGLEGFVPFNYVESKHKRSSKGVRKAQNRRSVGLNQVKFQEHVVVHCYEILSDEENSEEEEEVEAEAVDVTDMQNGDCSTWC